MNLLDSKTMNLMVDLRKSMPEAKPKRRPIPAKDYEEGFHDVFAFGKYHFPNVFTMPCGPHAEPILNCIKTGDRGQRINIIAPRSSSKSTYLATIYVMHCIYYKEEYERRGMKSDSFIIIVSDSEDLAISRVQDIRYKIEEDPNFQHLKGTDNWRTTQIDTANDVRVIPKGRHGQIRGQVKQQIRPSLIILDDVEDKEEVHNPDIRKRNWEWFTDDVLKAGAPDGSTNFIVIETVKHEEAITKKLATRTRWKNQFYSAIMSPKEVRHPEHEDLWEQWERIYTDLTIPDNEREAKAQAYYEDNIGKMMEGVEELWKEMLPYLEIRKMICTDGYSSVMREMQNSTRDPTRETFDMERAIRFSIHEKGLLRSDGDIVHWNDLSGATMFLDWAGGKDSKDNCFAAAVFVLWQPVPGIQEQHPRFRNKNQIQSLGGCYCYVLNAWLDKVPLQQQVHQCFKLIKTSISLVPQLRIDKINFAIEEVIKDTGNAIHDSIHRAFTSAQEIHQPKEFSYIQFHDRDKNKVERINTLQVPIANGWLAFHERLPEEFLKQMRQFPNGDFDDGPDALQGATELPIIQFPHQREELRYREMQQQMSGQHPEGADFGQGYSYH